MATPSILYLDEPAAGLTEDEIHGLVEIWRRCAQTMLVVIVEHNQELVSLIAEHVVVLLDGIVAVRGTPEEVRRDALVRRAYLGLDVAAETAVEASQR
jgi:ABC-type branched-subunit amino acid transport system ATPase component